MSVVPLLCKVFQNLVSLVICNPYEKKIIIKKWTVIFTWSSQFLKPRAYSFFRKEVFMQTRLVRDESFV